LGVDLMNLKAVIQKIAQRFMGDMKVDIEVVSEIIETESHMADTQAVPGNATAVADFNTAIQIALALKAIDPSLAVEAVQAGTNAAISALYPVA
jgi:hypothetical protein